MKENPYYIIAASKPWYKELYKWLKESTGDKIDWSYVIDPSGLNLAIKIRQPKIIFFPHWNWIVPKEIINAFECVCFHESPLPFGRGGSPIQNTITRGACSTKITAFRMTEELDAGPIYAQQDLSLEGTGEEIYLRIMERVYDMMCDFIFGPAIIPKKQQGTVETFKRRTPEQSAIDWKETERHIYDHIRMLDAPTYPKAFINVEDYRLEFHSAIQRMDGIHAQVRITKREDRK